MEDKSEQVHLSKRKAALRRLYYSHPIVIPKAYQTRINSSKNEDLEERKMKIKSAPLLSKRSKISENGSLVDKPLSAKIDNNLNHLSSSFKHNDVVKNDVVVFGGFNGRKPRENSSPAGKSNYNYAQQLKMKGKPKMLTALQINRCGIGNKLKLTESTTNERPIALLHQEFKKLNIGMMGQLSKKEPTALMFQQWGVRKSIRSGPRKFCNSWTNDRLSVEAWSQSIYAFTYESAKEEMKKRSKADFLKEAKATPLPPSPSPNNMNTFSRLQTSNRSLKGAEQGIGEESMQRKSVNRKNEAKVDIILIPPKDEWMNDVKKEGVDEMDLNRLSPTIDNFLKKDSEPLPSKVDDDTTKIVHEITMYNGSNPSLALDDVIDAIKEDKTGD